MHYPRFVQSARPHHPESLRLRRLFHIYLLPIQGGPTWNDLRFHSLLLSAFFARRCSLFLFCFRDIHLLIIAHLDIVPQLHCLRDLLLSGRTTLLAHPHRKVCRGAQTANRKRRRLIRWRAICNHSRSDIWLSV